MVRSGLRQTFGITSLLFSGYTLSLAGRVSGERRGGAAEILSRIGSGAWKLTSSTHLRGVLGPILTY